MKKIIKNLLKIKVVKYPLICLLSFLIVYMGIPGLSSALALSASVSGNPALIAIAMASGGTLASTTSQATGKLLLDNSVNDTQALGQYFTNLAQKHKKLVWPILITASVTAIPETYLYSTIGRHLSIIKITIINLIVRFLDFWLLTWLGKNYLKKIISLLKNIFNKKL